MPVPSERGITICEKDLELITILDEPPEDHAEVKRVWVWPTCDLLIPVLSLLLHLILDYLIAAGCHAAASKMRYRHSPG